MDPEGSVLTKLSLMITGAVSLVIALSLLLPASIGNSYFVQAPAPPGVPVITADQSVANGGGVYLCSSPTSCALRVPLAWADNVLCSTPTLCFVTSDQSSVSGGGVYYCDLSAGICSRKVALTDASSIDCPTATTCYVTSDISVASGGGIYSCNLGMGQCTLKVAISSPDFIICDLVNDCAVTVDSLAVSGGGLYGCDPTIASCFLVSPLDYASGLSFSGAGLVVTSDNSLPGGGLYFCTPGCVQISSLASADFLSCGSGGCFVTSDTSVVAGGGLYACAPGCLLEFSLGRASGVEFVTSLATVTVNLRLASYKIVNAQVQILLGGVALATKTFTLSYAKPTASLQIPLEQYVLGFSSGAFQFYTVRVNGYSIATQTKTGTPPATVNFVIT